jgi:hypothetical protein
MKTLSKIINLLFSGFICILFYLIVVNDYSYLQRMILGYLILTCAFGLLVNKSIKN